MYIYGERSSVGSSPFRTSTIQDMHHALTNCQLAFIWYHVHLWRAELSWVESVSDEHNTRHASCSNQLSVTIHLVSCTSMASVAQLGRVRFGRAQYKTCIVL